ncbi:MAG: glycosyltransferase family 4 protein [Candidatus Eisenbacteria sp.]|nr:glycosyltransferase family 4 protein [Candidatus Eisenbacteria bacterium]
MDGPEHPVRPEPRGTPPARPGRRSRGELRRLRIWLVSQSYLPYYGGITEHAWHLTAHLARRGHEVRLITGRPLRAAHPGDDPDPPGVTIMRTGRTLRIPSHGARACVTLGPRGPLSPEPLAPPDILHLQSPLEPFLPLWALHHLPGLKIGTFHTGGNRPHWGYRYLARWLERSARRLQLRLAISREAARFVSRHLPGRYRVIPNGVDLDRFSGIAGQGGKPEPPRRDRARVLFVGRLDPRKGLWPLLRAMAGIAADGVRGAPPAELIIVGDGPLRPQLTRYIKERGLPVIMAGAVPRARLASYYRAADLFVAPATDGESCGVTLLEALAAGLPIVASDLPGYRETLGPDPGGLFCTPGSDRNLHAALTALLTDPARRRRLAAAGRRRAQRFGWTRIAAEIEALYYEALAEAEAKGLGSVECEPRAKSRLSY